MTPGDLVNEGQRNRFAQEIAWARQLIAQRRFDAAFAHLERAHVLGQAEVRPHVLAHWLMLRLAMRQRQPAAALGQLARILLGAIGSAVGSVPTGNTGGSNVSMWKRMPIDPELLRVIDGRATDAVATPDRAATDARDAV